MKQSGISTVFQEVNLIPTLSVAENIYLGRQPRKWGRIQWKAIYAGAELFVFPSIYEGFGFPLLEAMAHGVPAIAARSSSLPEIGGDAALYFNPSDARELAALMQRVLGDGALRDDLAVRGRARAAQFRWEHAAEQTLEVLRSVSS